MSHITVHHLADIAARRIARTAQIAALAPYPERRPQSPWAFTRAGWAHASREGRPIGSFGALRPAAQLAIVIAERRGVPRHITDQIAAKLADVPLSMWTDELLASILPPELQEVIPELLDAAQTPTAASAADWATLTTPTPQGDAAPMISGGVAALNLKRLILGIADGSRVSDTRIAQIPAGVRICSLSALLQNSGLPTNIVWVAVPEIGIYWAIDGTLINTFEGPLTMALDITRDQPTTIEVGYDAVNTTGVPADMSAWAQASLSYGPPLRG